MYYDSRLVAGIADHPPKQIERLVAYHTLKLREVSSTEYYSNVCNGNYRTRVI